MHDRRTSDFMPSGALTACTLVVGICSLRPDQWPTACLPSWLDLHCAFALALCASAYDQLRRLLPPRACAGCGARQALRRMSRSLYSKIYWVIGISGSMDLAGAVLPSHPRASSLFEPAALAVGQLEPSRDLKLLVAYGIGALVAARLGAVLWVHQGRARAKDPTAGALDASAQLRTTQ